MPHHAITRSVPWAHTIPPPAQAGREIRMRAMQGMSARCDRWSTIRIPALAAATAVLLAGCHSDAPTGVAPTTSDAAPTAFTVTAAAVTAASLSTQRLSKVFPTLSILTAQGARTSSVVNSPYDLTWSGGPTVQGATNRNVYVNCTTTVAGCWGTGALTPATFLRDLNTSSLIQIADQYVNEDAAGKFSALQELATSTTFANNTASLNDVYAILFAASNFTKASGYNNIYHVFLPAGTDMCITSTECYSPDNPATFAFCAFHGSVNFGPHWHVLYTVQPYQAVPGCVLPTQTRVIDGTASTLSHEFFETVTDPDLDAWFNLLTGNEVADLCFGFRISQKISSNDYVVQEEYSNTIHDCTTGSF
jgi:hypothetical protein